MKFEALFTFPNFPGHRLVNVYEASRDPISQRWSRGSGEMFPLHVLHLVLEGNGGTLQTWKYTGGKRARGLFQVPVDRL